MERLSPKLRNEIAEVTRKLNNLPPKAFSPLDEEMPRRKGALYGSLDTICQLAEQQAEDVIQKLCRHRAETISMLLGSKGDDQKVSFDIADALEGTLPGWDLERAMKDGVLDDLGRICERLSSKDSAEQSRFLELRAEEVELRRVISIVHAILNGEENETRHPGASCTLSKKYQGKHDPSSLTGCKTARALAAAVMYANSFNPLDEKRLVFIASHVTQVLDNYLLHQARQRELDLDYKALDVLALDHFGLELLDALRSYTHRMHVALVYLLEREVRFAALPEVHLQTTIGSINGLVERLGPIRSIHDTNGQSGCTHEDKLVYPLVSI